MHKKKKVAEKVSPEKVLERVSTGEEDTETATEEPEEEPSQKLEDTDDRVDEEENSEETDDTNEDPESSPTKVILRESDLIRYTKSFEIYITPLTKEEIIKFSGGKRVVHMSSSSDSEFDEMVSP